MTTRLARYASGHSWVGYVVALALTALVTGAIGLVRQSANVANISILYLLAVLFTAVAFGSVPAVFASVAAFLAFDFFFVQPTHHLTVNNTEEWVALAVLLVTGVITGQLAAALRQRAREAERREREAVVLYDVVRLMQAPDLHGALTAVAERLREELELAAVIVDLGPEAPVALQAEAGDAEALQIARLPRLPPVQILSQGAAPASSRSSPLGRWIRVVPPLSQAAALGEREDRLRKIPINLQSDQIGHLVLVRRPGTRPLSGADDRLLLAAANQLGLTVERVRLREVATEAEILQRTDELKSALLNAVSHDLKTPLASIVASAGSLLQEDVAWTEEERREFARAIEEEAGYLNRLVGNLLDLSRIEAGSLRPDKDWYDVGALVDDVLGRLRPVTEQHAIVVDVPDDLPPVSLDYLEIGDVLFNLIENATKYTPSGTEIRVSARRDAVEVQVEVTDQGPGIPPQTVQRLFDPFYRVKGPKLRPKGMGLGLAVAKGLIEAHGGRIWAENAPGRGARFVFALPLAISEPSGTTKEEQGG